MRRFLLFLAAVGLLIGLMAGSAQAVVTFTLTDGTSEVSISPGDGSTPGLPGKPGSFLGAKWWTLDKGLPTERLSGFRQWFWWRSPGITIDDGLDAEWWVGRGWLDPTVTLIDANTARVTYDKNLPITVEIEYDLTGGSTMFLRETVRITNNSLSTLPVSWYAFWEPVLNRADWTPGSVNPAQLDDIPGLPYPDPTGLMEVKIQDPVLEAFMREESLFLGGGTLLAKRWEIEDRPDLLLRLNNFAGYGPGVTNLSNSNLWTGINQSGAKAGATGAFQWDVELYSTGYMELQLVKSIGPLSPPVVPEPSTWVLFGVGVVAVVGWRRRARAV